VNKQPPTHHRRWLTTPLVVIVVVFGLGWYWRALPTAPPAGASPAVRPAAASPLMADLVPAAAATSSEPSLPVLPPLPGDDDIPLAELFVLLEESALGGERVAACRLAAELDRCRKLPKLRADAVFWESNARRSDALLEYAIDAVARNEAAIASLEVHCAGITDEQLASGWRHQLRAADLGDREAALRYLLDPPLPERALDDLPGWAEYARRFAPMLEALAAGGDANAGLLLLAQLSGEHGQAMIPPDPYRAAIWAHALGELAADAEASFMLQMMIGAALADAERTLGPAEVARARDAGVRLYRERLAGAVIDQALLAGEGLAMRDPRECDATAD
jgi:hypothetical protein